MEDEFREQMRKMINTMEAVAHFISYISFALMTATMNPAQVTFVTG